jgi:hypothetical protein
MSTAFRSSAARFAHARVNYFNGLTLQQQLKQLAVCRFMGKEEFSAGCEALKDKKGTS